MIGIIEILPIIFYYLLVVFTGFIHLHLQMIKRLICIGLSFLLIFYLCIHKYQRTQPSNLVITCLDIGHGQAILTQLPGGKNILFDAGSLHNNNIGANVVVPFLKYKGINRIDYIIVSHNDTDHINGIPEIVRSTKVESVYANDAFFDESDQWGTAGFLKECLAEQNLEIKPLKDNIRSGDTIIKTLWPIEKLSGLNNLTDNNRSLVSLIEFAGVRILLCSDIEQLAQKQLLKLHPNLQADIVVIPHHGSVRTLDEIFLERLNAEFLICSCDQTQFERTTTQTNSTGKNTDRTRSFYTARDGAVTVTIGKDGSIKTETFLEQSPIVNSQ